MVSVDGAMRRPLVYASVARKFVSLHRRLARTLSGAEVSAGLIVRDVSLFSVRGIERTPSARLTRKAWICGWA